MLIKDLVDVSDERVRWEFTFLLDRCNCSRLAIEGRCTPRKCFPALYYAILGHTELTMKISKAGDSHYHKRITLIGDEKYQSWTKPETPSEI